jgi:hypothetical protein
MSDYTVTLNEDEALVLFEYFERFDETDDLSFRHAAEYIALQRLAGRICKTTSAMFKPEYERLLAESRSRLADGFQGEIPCFAPDEKA